MQTWPPEYDDDDVDEYVNPECPEDCSTKHDVPSGGRFTCPESGESYVYCDDCQEWYYQSGQVGQIITHNGNEVGVCEPLDHGFRECFRCSRWLCDGEDIINEPCYNTNPYCDDCWALMDGCDCPACRYEPDYDDSGPCDCDECNGYRENDDTVDGEAINGCPRCGSDDRHLDELTEMFFCPCSMKEILDKEPDHPFRCHKRTKVLA